MEERAQAVLPAIQARRDRCDAVVCCMSAPEIVKLTRIGRFNMDGSKRGAFDFLKKLRGSKKPNETGGAHEHLRGKLRAPAPVEYPEVGVYHPRIAGRVSENAAKLPAPAARKGTAGLLLMRSYILANNTAHYDAVIEALEARGLAVIPAFASGFDARPAVEAFFQGPGSAKIDVLLSLTGFSLVGGPAYNDSIAAAAMLGALDVPYLAARALEFQTIEPWEESERGLSPVEATMMVAIPELDGATAPMVFGGRSSRGGAGSSRDIQPERERVTRLAERVERLVRLRAKPRHERKIAILLFNFPPNGGATGTAAFLGVYESLHRTLIALKGDGYRVDVPPCVDALRERILEGNAKRHGAAANVAAKKVRSKTTSGASRTCARSRRSGARRRGAITRTARRCSCWESALATCWSPCSRPSATRATRCGCCSSAASPPPTPSRRSTAICAKISALTRSSISARMARWNSCRASRRGSLRRVGRSG